MPHALNGLRVVSFESRRSAEMAELIRNYRGDHDPGAVHARGPAVNMLELEILKVNNGAPAYFDWVKPRWTPKTGQLWRPLALGSLYTLWREETAMVVYAFDVDETLEVSKGPVKLFDLVKLREHGHIVGLCGNWAMVTLHYPDWHHICSFVGPCGIQKHDFLRQLRQYIPGHDYVMVGNILGISGASDDRGAAERAGWRFIQESEFAKGVR